MSWTIYTGNNCKWCDLAKQLLRKHRQRYTEIKLNDPKSGPNYEALNKLSGMGLTTVPQIFKSNEHIGGYTDLEEYYKNKEAWLQHQREKEEETNGKAKE